MTALRIVSTQDSRKDYINRSRLSEPKTDVFFVEFIQDTIDRKAKRRSESYVRNYRSLIAHLQNFAKAEDVKLYTNSINEEFLDDFITYMEDQGLKLGYIKTILSLIKAMARKAGNYGYAVDASYDDVTIRDEQSFGTYLSMNEITRIYYYQGLTKSQERIRDLFIVGCMTGLRYSDYSTLSKDNFQGNFIVKMTKKTKKKVTIPLHDYVKEIYSKYEGEIPSKTIQHFNRHIKNIAKKIGIDNMITYNFTRGGKMVTISRPKFELISSHTARRSFATNMYMTGRMKASDIMTITAHTTEKSFFRYIKITQDDTAKQIAGDNFFRK